MKNLIIKFIIPFIILTSVHCVGQTDQASLLLDLKKARAAYEIAKQKYENDKELLDNGALSEVEFNNSRNELLGAEVDYQKLILHLLSQQSYVIIEKAVKYQSKDGEKKVRITLKSTMEGNQDYLKQFEEHFDVFTPEMRSGKVYNIFVSLQNIEDQTIIGTPYEVRVPYIDLGGDAVASFKLLRDVESIQVVLNYNGKKDIKNIYLEKDSGSSLVDIKSGSFAQEADLGSEARFDLTLERFSDKDDVYHLVVLNLPRKISYDFIDATSNARLSQLRFNQGENIRKLTLTTYIPERDDEGIEIDKPLEFFAIALSKEDYEKLDRSKTDYTEEELSKIAAGKLRLELIPRGVGRIVVRAPSLYHEITTNETINMKIRLSNEGTRTIDNIKIETENPLNWKTVITPEVISSLRPGKEQEVQIEIIPPDDVEVGAQEVRIKTEALANNRRVNAEDKTVRIQVEAKTPIFSTILLVLLLVGIVIGVVIFGIRISKR
jgi:hypothetical protein